jgi:hypothetical protein
MDWRRIHAFLFVSRPIKSATRNVFKVERPSRNKTSEINNHVHALLRLTRLTDAHDAHTCHYPLWGFDDFVGYEPCMLSQARTAWPTLRRFSIGFFQEIRRKQ